MTRPKSNRQTAAVPSDICEDNRYAWNFLSAAVAVRILFGGVPTNRKIEHFNIGYRQNDTSLGQANNGRRLAESILKCLGHVLGGEARCVG